MIERRQDYACVKPRRACLPCQRTPSWAPILVRFQRYHAARRSACHPPGWWREIHATGGLLTRPKRDKRQCRHQEAHGQGISDYDIHIQFVDTHGVDGDSASITIATAIISAWNIPIRQDRHDRVLSVRGVLPIGGGIGIEAAARSGSNYRCPGPICGCPSRRPLRTWWKWWRSTPLTKSAGAPSSTSKRPGRAPAGRPPTPSRAKSRSYDERSFLRDYRRRPIALVSEEASQSNVQQGMGPSWCSSLSR